MSVAVPEELLKTPPPYWAEFPERVSLVSVRLPALYTPPPLTPFPLEIVSPEMLAVTPEFTVKTLKLNDGPPPLTVSTLAPGPVIVTFELIVRPLPRSIAPVTPEPNWIVLPGFYSLTLPDCRLAVSEAHQ